MLYGQEYSHSLPSCKFSNIRFVYLNLACELHLKCTVNNPSNIFKDQAELPRPSQKVKVILSWNSKFVVDLSDFRVSKTKHNT